MSSRSEFVLRPIAGLICALAALGAAGPPLRSASQPAARTREEHEENESGDLLDPEGARIGEITVRVGNVFDPESAGENHWWNRAVNRLHWKTRPAVLRKLLLFEEGDRYSQQRVEESERILREAHYLYDAEIRPVRFDGETVDVNVDTRDVWSLAAGVAFTRSGGSNSTRLGLEDTNFLGSGKALAFKHKSNVDRTQSQFRFQDPTLFGTRGQLRLQYSDNSDGQLRQAVLERPFFALDTRWAVGGSVLSDDREDSLYDLGEVTHRFRHRQEHYEVYGGVSGGLRKLRAHRWTFGFTYLQDRFEGTLDDPNPGQVPTDRELAYPWVQFSSLQDHYIEAHDVDHIHRTEDLNLGREITLRLGWSDSAFGADRQQAVVDFDWSQGMSPGDGQMLFVEGGLSGRMGRDGEENVLAGAGVRYLRRNLNDNLLLIAARGDLASNLDPENQLLLGGDTGLRGYPLRYLSGDGRALFTVEERFFTDWHLFKLVRVGFASFVDAGGTWRRNNAVAPDLYADRLLWDVGAGLRLASTRSSSGSLVSIDVATPLVRDDSISSVQVLVQTRKNF